MRFHLLNTEEPKPKRFTYPFCYTPHPLCVMAAKEVQTYIAAVDEWRDEIAKGKMFGVLVVVDENGQLGYYTAFSGILAGRNDWDFFVPAVYDLLESDGYFKIHEGKISEINKEVLKLEKATDRTFLISEIIRVKKEADVRIAEYQKRMKAAKAERDKARVQNADEEALIHESQYMKAELKRIRKGYDAILSDKEQQLDKLERKIAELKKERKRMSDHLQHWLFSQFRMLNAKGEVKDLCDIFEETVNKIPPAGAGECCAPKLLQYAYLHHDQPICMAEFWWGESPKTEIRHHLQYYPACQGKCKPILAHMLQGLDVDENPLEISGDKEIEIVYDDEWLAVINKPEGMLSVPGKGVGRSVYSIIKEMYPEIEGPVIVHRLDMATSGLMIIAKNKAVHQNLQAQFESHHIRKRYVAILDGIIENGEGKIALPLSPDYLDRPRQTVDKENGKTAVTTYKVVSEENGHTRINLFPHTGRTHQLRVHCAHKEGLNAPISGDTLYGKKADRLYLHAEEITFTHPITGKTIRIERKADF